MPNVIKERDTCFGEDPTECQERHPERSESKLVMEGRVLTTFSQKYIILMQKPNGDTTAFIIKHILIQL